MSIEKTRESPTIPPDEKRIDQAIEDTFPASDPSATTGGVTRIDPDRPKDAPGEPTDEDEATENHKEES
jgi:hypothetical protein